MPLFPPPLALIEGLRPKTLTLSLTPICVAATLSYVLKGPLDLLLLAVILCSAVLIQITTNLHNDVQDFLNGTDQADRPGPRRIVQARLATPRQVQNATILSAGLAAALGGYLIIIGGWPILLTGVCALACAFGYSSGPYPIARSPFGELLVLVFFGIVPVSLSFYLLSSAWDMISLTYGAIMGLPACAVLYINNSRDQKGDQKAGRRTLAIVLGPKAGQAFFVALVAAPYGLAALAGDLHIHLLTLLPALLISGVCLYQFLGARTPSTYNRCLGLAALSQLLLALGLMSDLLMS